MINNMTKVIRKLARTYLRRVTAYGFSIQVDPRDSPLYSGSERPGKSAEGG